MQITTIVQQTMQKSNRIFNQKKEKKRAKNNVYKQMGLKV